MRIAIVGDDLYRQRVKNIIVKTNLTCLDNVIELIDVVQATDFISNSVIANNKHIDLIIADDNTLNNVYQKNLCDWIRSIQIEKAYSNSNFRAISIPIILFKKDIREKNEIESRYNAIISYQDNQFDGRLASVSRNVIRYWRQDILHDLDILNLDLKVLKNGNDFFNNYNKVTRNSSYYLTRTNNLSENFIKFPRYLDYSWLDKNNLTDIEYSISEYEKIIKGLKKFNRKSFERDVLHKFYNQHTHFLLRDTYDNLIYDRRFVISSTSAFHIPDFILTSPFPKFQNTSISEIKRHNIQFQYLPNRHRNFTDYFRNALDQSSNYEDDFNKSHNQAYLQDRLGYATDKFQVDLIIGLDENINRFVMDKVKKHYETINIVTHNSLNKQNEDFYYRSKSLSIY